MKKIVIGLILAFGLCILRPLPAIAQTDFPKSLDKHLFQTGYISNPAIKESSGVITCGYDTNLFWTHNDGGRPILYAIDKTGKTHAQFVITGAALIDWEDIARDDSGNLYIGDIGNNYARRAILAVYRIKEPDPSKKTGIVSVDRSWRLTFPDKPFDCESLFIWKGDAYVISKVFNDAPAAIYKFSLNDTNNPIKLQFVVTLPVTSPVTGADISPDGSLLAMTAKNGVYSFKIDGDVSAAGKVKPFHVKFKNEHIEGCCFTDEGLLVTSEDRGVYLFTHKHFKYKSETEK